MHFSAEIRVPRIRDDAVSRMRRKRCSAPAKEVYATDGCAKVEDGSMLKQLSIRISIGVARLRPASAGHHARETKAYNASTVAARSQFCFVAGATRSPSPIRRMLDATVACEGAMYEDVKPACSVVMKLERVG